MFRTQHNAINPTSVRIESRNANIRRYGEIRFLLLFFITSRRRRVETAYAPKRKHQETTYAVLAFRRKPRAKCRLQEEND